MMSSLLVCLYTHERTKINPLVFNYTFHAFPNLTHMSSNRKIASEALDDTLYPF